MLEPRAISVRESCSSCSSDFLQIARAARRAKSFAHHYLETTFCSNFFSRYILSQINFQVCRNFWYFSSEISKTIINHFWNNTIKDVSYNFIDNKSNFDLLETIIKSNSGIKHSKALKLFDVLIVSKEVGFDPLRKLLRFTGKKNRCWYKLLEELKDLNLPQMSKYSIINDVSKMIRNFEPLSLKYYQLNH